MTSPPTCRIVDSDVDSAKLRKITYYVENDCVFLSIRSLYRAISTLGLDRFVSERFARRSTSDEFSLTVLTALTKMCDETGGLPRPSVFVRPRAVWEICRNSKSVHGTDVNLQGNDGQWRSQDIHLGRCGLRYEVQKLF